MRSLVPALCLTLATASALPGQTPMTPPPVAAPAPPAAAAAPSPSPSPAPTPATPPPATAPTLPPGAPAPAAAAAAFPELDKERGRLVLENAVEAEKLKQRLAPVEAERQQIAAENALARERLGQELAAKRAEIERINVEIEASTKRTALAAEARKAELEKELAGLRTEAERLRVANDIVGQRTFVRQGELNVARAALDVERGTADLAAAKRQSEITLRDRNEEWRNQVNRDIEYSRNPLNAAGELVITDRRIALNGVITMATADFVADRVNYFNNQSGEFPIFLVIDSSPGGSVMAGYKILKTMEGSAAPVYVVVKSFAASMAAGITTLAKHSFAYPNAIILHHQLLSFNVGNPVQQRENLREIEEWWKRLAGPVANKMGVPLEEFVRQMYVHNSEGDWREFGDAAVKLKWVDATVERIREASLVKNPDKANDKDERRPGLFPFRLETRTDAQGRAHEVLPRLDPFDCWYLFNRDGFYQTP